LWEWRRRGASKTAFPRGAWERVLLDEANLNLEFLRFQMRLAKDLQCLKVESYTFAAQSIDEIGRLIGCWLPSKGEQKA